MKTKNNLSLHNTQNTLTPKDFMKKSRNAVYEVRDEELKETKPKLNINEAIKAYLKAQNRTDASLAEEYACFVASRWSDGNCSAPRCEHLNNPISTYGNRKKCHARFNGRICPLAQQHSSERKQTQNNSVIVPKVTSGKRSSKLKKTGEDSLCELNLSRPLTFIKLNIISYILNKDIRYWFDNAYDAPYSAYVCQVQIARRLRHVLQKILLLIMEDDSASQNSTDTQNLNITKLYANMTGITERTAGNQLNHALENPQKLANALALFNKNIEKLIPPDKDKTPYQIDLLDLLVD